MRAIAPVSADASMFALSSECLACHNNLVAPTGEDVSIGASWRGSIMANSARDPYVLASVRREILDHPSLAAEIEDECAACHMPAAQKIAKAAGGHGQVFWDDGGEAAGPLKAHGQRRCVVHGLPSDFRRTARHPRQLQRQLRRRLAARQRTTPRVRRRSHRIAGRSRIMHSVTGFEQEQAAHIQQSELCATCHTLVTVARGPDGAIIGSLPEQMHYQEWRHSAFDAERRSCQSCHMPAVDGPVRVASVLGEERPRLARHTFLGGNAFMLRLMNRFRDELGIEATSRSSKARRARRCGNSKRRRPRSAIERATMAGDTLELDVVVRNLTGHKFPTGYPSRRAWIHVTAMDAPGPHRLRVGTA